MTDRAPDRDGLQLDQLPLPVGPFLPGLPPGLALDVKLQGDVIQDVAVGANPFVADPGEETADPGDDVFERALLAPVPIADLELARARHHLHWLADALQVQGLPALGRRSRRLAHRLTPDSGPALDRLCRLVAGSQVLRWSLPCDRGDAFSEEDGFGPLSRAAGRRDDARLGDPAYRALGFDPVVHERGDVASRWRQRLAEARQAVALARAARTSTTSATEVVEGPRGPISGDQPSPSARLLTLLPALLTGLEWGDAIAVIVSLDLDLEAAARRPLVDEPASTADRDQA
jgi:hypothetical protein